MKGEIDNITNKIQTLEVNQETSHKENQATHASSEECEENSKCVDGICKGIDKFNEFLFRRRPKEEGDEYFSEENPSNHTCKEDCKENWECVDRTCKCVKGFKEKDGECVPDTESPPRPKKCEEFYNVKCEPNVIGDKTCIKINENSGCDRDYGICTCSSDSQDFPNCCWPSCWQASNYILS